MTILASNFNYNETFQNMQVSIFSSDSVYNKKNPNLTNKKFKELKYFRRYHENIF